MRSYCPVLLALLVGGTLLSGACAATSSVRMASVNAAGAGSGNAPSGLSRISADGRHVIFASSASNLVPGVGNGKTQLFCRENIAGVTALVSVNAAGNAPGNGPSLDPVVSANGRYVAFESEASDLVPNDTNGVKDVFVRDMAAGVTYLISVGASGGGGNGASFDPVIGADGQVVAFESLATDIVSGDVNGVADIFARSWASGGTRLVSTDSTGTVWANATSFDPVLSRDGSVIAFETRASNLVPGDRNGTEDVFVRDLAAGTTLAASVKLGGGGCGNGTSFDPSISLDGNRIAFGSRASNLVPNDANGAADAFVYERSMGTVQLVSVNAVGAGSGNGATRGGVRISPDGGFVAFTSAASDLVANDTNGPVHDTFLRDLAAASTALVSVTLDGAGSGNGPSGIDVRVSEGGRFVVFDSEAYDIGRSDSNRSLQDVFVRDMRAGVTTLASINTTGTRSGNGGSFNGHISADGRTVSFDSAASDLVAQDGNFAQDVFTAFLNTPPVAVADRYTVRAGNRLIVGTPGVLGNDSDTEGDPIRAVLVEKPVNGLAGLAANGTLRYDPNAGFVGTDRLTYRATDGYALGNTVTVRIDVAGNRGPRANAGPDQTLECAGASTPVLLDGSLSFDPDGDPLTYQWFRGTALLATGVKPQVALARGKHTLRLQVTDSLGASSSDYVAVNVADTTPPRIHGLVASLETLTPADGRLVSVTLSYTVTDVGDPKPYCSAAITSNEQVSSATPDPSDPTLSTSPDWKIVSARQVYLRAECSPKGNGRVYTITVTCRDAAGNSTSQPVEVRVPKG